MWTTKYKPTLGSTVILKYSSVFWYNDSGQVYKKDSVNIIIYLFKHKIMKDWTLIFLLKFFC